MFRRGFRPLRPFRRGLGSNAPQNVQRANALMAEGKYLDAADLFEEMARFNESRFGSAPFMHLRDGEALSLAGQLEQGLDRFKLGLSQLAEAGKWQPLQNIGQRFISELRKAGHNQEAQEIVDYLKQVQSTMPQGSLETIPHRAVLPAKCPGCGAPVRPDEVKWLNNVTAECGYCGNTIRAET